ARSGDENEVDGLFQDHSGWNPDVTAILEESGVEGDEGLVFEIGVASQMLLHLGTVEGNGETRRNHPARDRLVDGKALRKMAVHENMPGFQARIETDIGPFQHALGYLRTIRFRQGLKRMLGNA